MGKIRKWMLNMGFLALVMGGTAYGLLRGTELSQLYSVLKEAKIWPLLLGVGCVLGFILLESVILWLVMRALGHGRPLGHCSLYSFVGFFFSCITPSAGGGQPAQVYFMHKDGVGAGISVPVMILVTITYKLVLVVYGLGVMIFRPKGIMEAISPLWWWCVLGLVLNILVVSGYGALLIWPKGTERMLQKLLGILPVSRTRKEKLKEKLVSSMMDYRGAAKLLGSRKKLCASVFAITLVQRTLLFFVCYLAIKSLGLSGSPADVVILQAIIALGTDLLPLPGGMGANEAMFMGLFEGITGAHTLPVLLISRGISYYAQLILSAVFTVVAAITIGKGK